MPGAMLGGKRLDLGAGLVGLQHGQHLGDGLLHGRVRLVVGFEKARVGGRLVAAEAGLLVDHQPLDQGGQGDALVGLLDERDGLGRVVDLPEEDAGQQKKRQHRQEEDLAQNPFELAKLQWVPSFARGYPVV